MRATLANKETGEISTKSITVDLDGANRVVGDHSVWAREDGSYFDHNGSTNYRDIDELLAERPDLGVIGERKRVKGKNKMAKNDALAKVTKSAQWIKGVIPIEIIDSYLPFYDLTRIMSNIGTYNDNLAVFMWTPTKSGAVRGRHYSSVQYRTDDPKQKWKYIKGSDSKTVESMTPYDSYVYSTFGMGDFLLLKSTRLNYLCFGSDGAVKNTPHIEYIKDMVGKRTLRVIQDNDQSGRSVIRALRSMGLHVQAFVWGKHAKPKMDLRDIGFAIKQAGGDIDNLIKEITKGERYV